MKRRVWITLLLLTLLSVQPLAIFAQDQTNTLYLPLIAGRGNTADSATGAWSAAQPPSAQPQPFAGNRQVRVMTRNLYFGTDLMPLLAVQNPAELPQVAAAVYTAALATDLPGRMKAIADEIAATQPLLVGLQEAALWRTGPVFHPDPATVVQADFVQMLLAALAERGLPYAALVVVSGSDAEVPTSLGIDVRLTLQDAILARTDLKTAI